MQSCKPSARHGTTTPMTPERSEASARPAPFLTYPSSATAWATRSRSSGLTTSGALSARDTEAVETPAALATSRAVAMMPPSTNPAL